jgi:hypothetical protein
MPQGRLFPDAGGVNFADREGLSSGFAFGHKLVAQLPTD